MGPTCRCGFGRDHLMVSAVYRYSWWQAALVYVWGVSYPPRQIDYRCRVCGEVVETSAHPTDEIDPDPRR